jgi:hypothetical protein
VRALRPLAIATIVSAAGCGGASDPVSSPGPSAPTLLAVQSQIFTPRCALSGCHVGTGAPFGMDLSSVANSQANLIGVPSGEKPSLMRIAPGDSANSYLYWKVTANPGIGGDPMPLTGGPLSGGDLNLIASWVDGGAN